MQDGLTKIANRRAFDGALDLEWRRASRSRQPLALILIDVDFPEGSDAALGLLTGLRAEGVLRAPVVCLAERNDMAARLDAVRAGSTAYFSKPFENDEILATLRRIAVGLAISSMSTRKPD